MSFYNNVNQCAFHLSLRRVSSEEAAQFRSCKLHFVTHLRRILYLLGHKAQKHQIRHRTRMVLITQQLIL